MDEIRLATFVAAILPYTLQSKLELIRYWRRRVEEATPGDKLGFKPVGHRLTIWY